MAIQPLRNDHDLRVALARIEALWGRPAGTPEGDELDDLLALVEHYEAQHHPLPPGDPIAVIGFKMKELGLSQRELARRLSWGSGRVSEVLNGQRDLTLRMVRDLARVLEVPVGLLVGEPARPGFEDLCLPLSLQQELSARARARGLRVEDWLRQALDRDEPPARPIRTIHIGPPGTGKVQPLSTAKDLHRHARAA